MDTNAVFAAMNAAFVSAKAPDDRKQGTWLMPTSAALEAAKGPEVRRQASAGGLRAGHGLSPVEGHEESPRGALFLVRRRAFFVLAGEGGRDA